MIKKILSYCLSIITIFIIWILIAYKINAPLILPYPDEVFTSLINLVLTKKFWVAFAATFGRVILSFIMSILIGLIIGFLCGISDFAKDFFELPLSFMRSTPVVAVILVTMFWFNSKMVPVVVSILMALPIITTSVTTGLRQSSEKFLMMTKCYQLSGKQIFRYIKLPLLKPHFYNSCESIFGLCWKVVAAGEVLSLPRNGIGTIMQTSQVHLETSTVMAVTIVLVLVSFILQKLLGLLK